MRSSPTGSASSSVCFSTAPLDSTTTTSAVVGVMPTSCTERTRGLRRRRADDDAGVGGEVAEQARGVLQHLLELAVGLLEERAHLHGVVAAEAGGLAEVVDEEAVALLGGDPAGAGVGLAEVALLLEGGHVVAHRGRRHLHAGGPHDVRGPHRLGGVDVLLHDGPEDGGLAFVEHQGPGTRCYRVPARRSRFRTWQGGADAVRGGGCGGGRRRGRRAAGPARPRRRARGRGAHHGQAIAADGLLVRSPDDEVRVPVPVVDHPSRARRSPATTSCCWR